MVYKAEIFMVDTLMNTLSEIEFSNL
jgi:hypothetical protein